MEYKMAVAGKGRSPLTRGSHEIPAVPLLTLGSIPAHAGEPRMRFLLFRCLPVDPRSRGGAARG